MEHTVTLTTAEYMALGYAAVSPEDWIDNAIHYRCSVAIEDIVKICVEKCLASNIQIPGSKDAIVELAFEKGWVKLLAESHAEQTSSTPFAPVK
jgi:hypothetical protein